MKNEGYTIENLSEYMNTEEIVSAWEEIEGAISIITDAINNRLCELDYDEDEYEEGSNDEIDTLLEVLDKADNATN